MSTYKHPAEELADRCEQAQLEYELPATVEQLVQDCADMLRAIPALEAERDKFRAMVESSLSQAQRAIDKSAGLLAERDALRADVAILRDALLEAEAGLFLAGSERPASTAFQPSPMLALRIVRAALDGAPAQPAAPKPMDDPHLQRIFGDAIRGALALGAGNECPPPVGHWLAPWWQQGRDVAAAPVAQPLTDEQIDDAIARHVDPVATYRKLHDFVRAIERAHGIT